MAAMRAKVQPAIGSAQWIQDENAQVSVFCGQEAEDFAFSARNEVEWLNEHMAEIFSKDQMSVADVFKTPGKLRGKTPRTARKRNQLEARQPLSDIFCVNAQSNRLNASQPSPPKAASPAKVATFKVAEDESADQDDGKEPASNADSGYHGLPDDDMDIDPTVQSLAETHDTLDDFPHSPPANKVATETSSTDHSAMDRSFHSAREELTKKDVAATSEPSQSKMEDHVQAQDEEQGVPEISKDDEMQTDTLQKGIDENIAMEESRSSSQESTPARGLVRKSSLTFAALPARQPITTKQSIGNRVSRTSQLEQSKAINPQNSLLGRLTGGKSLGGVKQHEKPEVFSEEEASNDRPALPRDESDLDSGMMKLHSKSSTQRLHERINMLGKPQQPRPTKSIPALTSMTQPSNPDLSRQGEQKQAPPSTSSIAVYPTKDEEEDDWIQPPQPTKPAQTRRQLTQSISATVVESPRSKQLSDEEQARKENVETAKSASGTALAARPSGRHVRAASASQSPLPEERPPRTSAEDRRNAKSDFAQPVESSTTPHGSPQRYVDGSLSASKSRLQSIMKSARGLFSSSANTSAFAKMEAMDTAVVDRREVDSTLHHAPAINAIGSGVQQTNGHWEQAQKEIDAPPAIAPESRKTRSSTEKEAREKERDRQQIEREKEKVRQQVAASKADKQSKEDLKEAGVPPAKPTRQSPRKTQPGEDLHERGLREQSLGPTTHESGRPSQVQRPKDVRRPIKPAKEMASQSKAPPVNIRIGMPSRRVPLNNTALASNLQDSLAPSQAKQPGVVKKAGSASIHGSGAGNNTKSSAPAAKPKALIAAERKKEQDEKEAQRKLDQKREIERRRAVQQEEARRQEQNQRQEAEKQRERERAAAADEPKKLAQRQAIEKRRLEMQKKEQRPAHKAVNEHVHGGTHQSHAASTNRPELGGSRPPSRQANLPEQNRAATAHPVNTSKAPIKRVFDPEHDNVPSRPAKPQAGQNYQQHDNKRRRTEDEELEEFPMRPTTIGGPPIRQSNIRKDGPKSSIFSVPHPAATHPNQLLKSTTTSQAYQQHLYQSQQPRLGYQTDISKYRDGNRIPFADNPNPPHQQQHQTQQFKTPFTSKLAHPPRHSPHYPNGENIQLAEIPTDSEDSDSSPDTAQKRQRAASLPEWVQSPYLNNLLRSQEEYMDPDAVFGPVESPHLEEMFRERAHKFRPRTSSANWTGQDRLTQDEIRRDAEARARIRREGGWTFGGTT